ncbi:MAG TPA: hypothetical protein ENI80_10575 [Acidiferrobacteraceae bacterium]|nr:hypothetical protein [Acidiferrobacteraceae bacterium]
MRIVKGLAIAGTMFVLTACGGGGSTSSGGGSGSGGGGGSGSGSVSLVGYWSGTVRSGIEGTMDAVMSVDRVSGSSLNGVLAINQSLCIPGGSTTGTVNGSSITFSGRNPFGGNFTVSGSVSGNRFTGSYSSVGSFSCNRRDTGTISLTKINY